MKILILLIATFALTLAASTQALAQDVDSSEEQVIATIAGSDPVTPIADIVADIGIDAVYPYTVSADRNDSKVNFKKGMLQSPEGDSEDSAE